MATTLEKDLDDFTNAIGACIVREPGLRLGQVLANAIDDLYYVENDTLTEILTAYSRREL
jgi:hypothetical protein